MLRGEVSWISQERSSGAGENGTENVEVDGDEDEEGRKVEIRAGPYISVHPNQRLHTVRPWKVQPDEDPW